MFLLDNIFIILLVSIAFFVLFTFFNISTFSRSLTTTVYLTIIFLDSFFRMPFKAVNTVYHERETLLKLFEKEELTEKQKEKVKQLLHKRSRIFIVLYRAGEFSYSERLISFTEWYKNKPFTVRIIIDFDKEERRRKNYETRYLSEMKKDLVCLEMT